MSKGGEDETARDRLIRLVRRAKSAGKGKTSVSSEAITRIAEEFSLEAGEAVELFHQAWDTA